MFFFFLVAYVSNRHNSIQFGICDRPWRILGVEQCDADHLVDTGLRF